MKEGGVQGKRGGTEKGKIGEGEERRTRKEGKKAVEGVVKSGVENED